jgi:hypothetical protein
MVHIDLPHETISLPSTLFHSVSLIKKYFKFLYFQSEALCSAQDTKLWSGHTRILCGNAPSTLILCQWTVRKNCNKIWWFFYQHIRAQHTKIPKFIVNGAQGTNGILFGSDWYRYPQISCAYRIQNFLFFAVSHRTFLHKLPIIYPKIGTLSTPLIGILHGHSKANWNWSMVSQRDNRFC